MWRLLTFPFKLNFSGLLHVVTIFLQSSKVVAYGKQKRKEYVKFLALKVIAFGNLSSGRSREFMKQYLTEKQSGYLQLVVAYGRWSLGESWLYLI